VLTVDTFQTTTTINHQCEAHAWSREEVDARQGGWARLSARFGCSPWAARRFIFFEKKW
jgi:hypothetical protein